MRIRKFTTHTRYFIFFLKSASLGLLAFTLGACQSIQEKRFDERMPPPQFHPGSLLDETSIQSLETADLAIPAEGEKWTASALIAVATGRNPELASARAAQTVSEAGLDLASKRPPIGLNFDLQKAISGATSPWTYGFSLDGFWETGGKRVKRLKKARIEINRTAIELARVQWSVRSKVLDSIVLWKLAEARIQNMETFETLASENLAATKSAFDFGSVDQSAELAAKLVARQLSVQRGDSELLMTQARISLATALGLPSNSLAGLSLVDLPVQLPELPAQSELLERAILTRPEVLAAMEDFASSDASLRESIAMQHPDLRLSPGYSYDQGQGKWQFGLGLVLPRNGNRAMIREASAVRDLAAARVEEAQLAAFSEIDSAYSLFNATRAQWQEAIAASQIATAQETSAKALKNFGAGTRLAELRAEIDAMQAKLAEIDLKAAAWTAYLKLQDALRAPLYPFN